PQREASPPLSLPRKRPQAGEGKGIFPIFFAARFAPSTRIDRADIASFNAAATCARAPRPPNEFEHRGTSAGQSVIIYCALLPEVTRIFKSPNHKSKLHRGIMRATERRPRCRSRACHKKTRDNHKNDVI